MKKTIDIRPSVAHISIVTQGDIRTGNDLSAFLAEAGYVGRAGVEAFADLIGVTWRTMFRWRAKGDKPLDLRTVQSIKNLLATTQAHSSRIRPASRKSKTQNHK